MSKSKGTFDTCCCCIELRQGCIIWGYLELLGVVYYVFKLGTWCKNFDLIIDMLKTLMAVPKETEEVIRSVGIGLIIFLCILWGIKIFFNVIFLRGLHMDNKGHVGAYLLYTFIFIIVGLITNIVMISMLATMEKLKLPGAVTGSVVFGIIVIYLIMLYFWLVIKSHYCNMDIKRKPEGTVQYRS